MSSSSIISTRPIQPIHDSTSHDFSSSESGSNRKRRAGGLLKRIDLSTCARKKLFGDSNESLNTEDSVDSDQQDGMQSSPGSDDCLSIAGTDLEGEENLKRLRLISSQSSSRPDDIEFSVDEGSPSEEWRSREKFFISLSGTLNIKKETALVPNLSELENTQEGSKGSTGGSSSLHYTQVSSGGLVLQDHLRGATFELVGDGRNCKAVEAGNQTMWHCQIIKAEEYRQIAKIMIRMQLASKEYTAEEFEQRSNLLLPLNQIRILRSPQRSNLIYILLPDHHGTLHQIMEESELSYPSEGSVCFGEKRIQPILKQIAILLEFCHRIGLYFRDFRLRKFVFTDSEKTHIRLNNIYDLYLAPNIACDSLISREFIPAYVAPEVLDKKNDIYGGRAADVWAFGVLMFTLLNGRYPFFESSPNPIALLRRIRAHRFSFPILQSISEEARWLILSLLSPIPEDRPTANELLQAHWFRDNRKLLPDKLANNKDHTGSRSHWNCSKSTSPNSANFLLTPSMARAMDPINITIMAHIQNTGIRPAPIGQVPSRLSPPMAPLNDTNSFISPIALQEQFNSDHRRQLTRHVRALIVDEPIQLGSTNMNMALGHPLQRTVSETRQPARSAQRSHRQGPQQAPTFVPIGTWARPIVEFRASRIGVLNPNGTPGNVGGRSRMMMRLMPTSTLELTVNDPNEQKTRSEKNKKVSEVDQVVPERPNFFL